MISFEQYNVIDKFLNNLNIKVNVFDFLCNFLCNQMYKFPFDYNYEKQRQLEQNIQNTQNTQNTQENIQSNLHAVDKLFPKLLRNNTANIDPKDFLDEILEDDDFLCENYKTTEEILEIYQDRAEKSKRLELLKKLEKNALERLENFVKTNNLPIIVDLDKLNNLHGDERKNELRNILTNISKYLHPDINSNDNHKTELLKEFNSIWEEVKKNYIQSKNNNWYKYAKFILSI